MPNRNLSARKGQIKGDLIPASQRAYVASHPLGICVAIGFAFSGLVNLTLPHLVRESAVSIALPSVLYYAFSAIWAVGGTCAAWGLIRGIRNLEAGGDVLLATSLIVNYIAVISVRTNAALGAIFIPFLALGFILRVRHLSRSGYVVLAIPLKDDPLR